MAVFKKGKSGNKGGRPPGKSMGAVLREMLEQRAKSPRGAWLTKKEILSEVLYDIAKTGDVSAIKLILAYTDGAPKQQIQHSGALATGDITSLLQNKELREKANDIIHGIALGEAHPGGADVDSEQ